MGQGITPSVAELAEHAQVSRATAYRYFPSQSALIAAVVDESLGPIRPGIKRRRRRRARRRAAAFRLPAPGGRGAAAPAIQVSLQQHAEASAGRAGNEPRLVRGHRVDILKRAIAPLAALTPAQQERVAQALSLVYGTEVFLVLGHLAAGSARSYRGGALDRAGHHQAGIGGRRGCDAGQEGQAHERRQEQRQARRLGRPGSRRRAGATSLAARAGASLSFPRHRQPA